MAALVNRGSLVARGRDSGPNRDQQIHLDQQLLMSPDSDTLFEGTPTVVVPNVTLKSFAGTDLPLIIATDHRGIIYSNQSTPHEALTPTRDADWIVRHTLAARATKLRSSGSSMLLIREGFSRK
jgi:hypothetical protein